MPQVFGPDLLETLWLPHPLVYGAAAVVNDVFYLIGGVTDPASTKPLNEFWALALSGPERASARWQRLPDFPGDAVILPAVASDGKYFYVFGGMRYHPGKSEKPIPKPSHAAHRFDPSTQTWARLADLPGARVGAATPSPQLLDGHFLIAGGYRAVFPGPLEDHPGFDQGTLLYSPSTNTWAGGPDLLCKRQINPQLTSSPGPEPMIGAPAVIWQNRVVLISGEIRPATRSPAVVALPVDEVSQ